MRRQQFGSQPGRDGVEVDRPGRGDVEERPAPQRLGALGEFDQFGDIGRTGMAGGRRSSLA